MAYRIDYGRKRRNFGVLPVLLGLIAAGVIWLGTDGYDDLARYVGGMILGTG